MKKRQSGFTITEIIVATAIFATVLVLMMSIFVLTLKLNRRSDALRQASQGARNFVEFLAKEIRNGKIDYGVENGSLPLSEVAPCPFPADSGQVNTWKYGRIGDNEVSDWALGIVNIDGERECFYWSRSGGDGTEPSNTNGSQPNNAFWEEGFNSLYFRKEGVSTAQKLNPPNFTIDFLRFYVRPNRDPYTSPSPRIQPSVTIVMQFTANLPTGERITIPYQTTISTNNYDIPAQ